ncbi:sodium pump decarboxylase subunit gamma [Shewanella maritima]|uniref:Probable oxaloacetate decarboxylase gamma chain n=1 Tax=Shewanella maritima TaxID=2520507 RepID=A0A411PEY0_9GAMM|nr:OadG family transporter subunit [Shewanella maritima]QBF82147.1 sodium pump decarboxylase subunit gamma [Shewanella maritima]
MGELSQQLSEALSIMIMGMGLVFIFLSTLIIGISIVARLFPATQQAVVPTQAAVNTQAAPAGTLDPALVAAITTAVHQYRKQHRQS